MLDGFYKLETVEQKLKYLDDTITPIVFEALTEFKNQYNLPGTLHKHFYFEEDSGYEEIYKLVYKHGCIIRVMHYSDMGPDFEMQNCYWIQLFWSWPKDKLTKGLSKQHILETLEDLKQASGEINDYWNRQTSGKINDGIVKDSEKDD